MLESDLGKTAQYPLRKREPDEIITEEQKD